MPTKYKNISATFVYTVEITVCLDEEYDCLHNAEQELESLADSEWRTPIAHMADVEMVGMKFDEEEESSEEGEEQ
jgi:hypothetical protein